MNTVREIKPSIAVAKAAFNNKNFFTRKLDLNLRNKLVKRQICSTSLCGAESWTFRKVDKHYLDSFELWFCRRTDRVKNEDALHSVEEGRSILQTIKRGNFNSTDNGLHRNCLVRRVNEVQT